MPDYEAQRLREKKNRPQVFSLSRDPTNITPVIHFLASTAGHGEPDRKGKGLVFRLKSRSRVRSSCDSAGFQVIIITWEENMNSTSPASLPTSLTKSATNVSIGPSGSGSFQSHLSTTNSQQRLRATCSYVSPPKDPLSYPKDHPYTLSQSTRTITSFIHALLPSQVARPIDDRSLSLRSWPTVWLKCAALVYCCLSLVFMSRVVYKRIHGKDLHSLSTLKPQGMHRRMYIRSLANTRVLFMIRATKYVFSG